MLPTSVIVVAFALLIFSCVCLAEQVVELRAWITRLEREHAERMKSLERDFSNMQNMLLRHEVLANTTSIDLRNVPHPNNLHSQDLV